MARIQYIDEPNMIVPLASSFNQRGILGYTQAVTNADDQLKINSVYEPVVNAGTGKATLYLVSRPGVTDQGLTYGTSTNRAYLYESGTQQSDGTGTGQALFYTVGTTSTFSATSSVSVLVTTLANTHPMYVDKTKISGKEFIVLQVGLQGATQSVHYTDHVSTGFSTATLSLAARGKMEFLDGYAFYMGTDGRIFNSALNTLSTWPNSSYLHRESTDTRVGLGRLGPRIISFGSATMEVYRNAGTPFGSPLEAVPQLSLKQGLSGIGTIGMRHYYAVAAERLYFTGANPHGVFAYNGELVEKVSSPAIDKILAEQPHYSVSRIGFSGKVAVAFGLNHVSSATQRALLFFPSWKDWFLWESTVFIPQASERSDNLFLGATGNQHKLYEVATSTSTFQDAGANYTWTHQFKLPKRGNGFQRMDMFGLVGDTASTSQLVNVQFSDDDYASFTTARTIDMSGTDKMLTRCGGYRSRAIKLSYAGDQALRLEAVMARIS